ncbi:MAG: class I SAM-dependent methyltransferase [Planctomycetota bacterium]
MARKHEFYDRYWEDATSSHFDRRSRERAEIAAGMLEHKSGKLLDAGAGRGIVSAFFKNLGFDVTAIDISQHALAYCRQYGVETCLMDLEVGYPIGMFDVVLALEVLEHLEKPAEVLSKLVGATNTDGEIIISLPNDRNVYHSRLPQEENAPHADIYDEAKARKLIESCGLKIARSERVPLLPTWCVGVRRLIADFFPHAGTISVVFHCRKAPGVEGLKLKPKPARADGREDPETVEFEKVDSKKPPAEPPESDSYL